MSKLAIKGHLTRGKEVIQILEMLGACNQYDYMGDCQVMYYEYNGINKSYIIKRFYHWPDCTVFTLEKFLEKFPYKVGDKVKYRNNIFHIKSSQWDCEKNTVIYYIDADWSAGYVVEADDLQPYKR